MIDMDASMSIETHVTYGTIYFDGEVTKKPI
jgi:hypothetical protein